MAATPKRRISTGRSGRRRQNKIIDPNKPGTYVSSRDRRTAKRATSQTSDK